MSVFNVYLSIPSYQLKSGGQKKKQKRLFPKVLCVTFVSSVKCAVTVSHTDHAPGPITRQYGVRLDKHGVYLENAWMGGMKDTQAGAQRGGGRVEFGGMLMLQ